jgi:hypothetical protein
MITLSNGAAEIAIDSEKFATHSRGQAPGEVFDFRQFEAARDRGEQTPYIFGGEQHPLKRYATGSLVLLPREYPTRPCTLWDCYRVIANPDYEPSGPGYEVPIVSFDEFNVRRAARNAEP